jgi:MFS family permease
VLALLALVTLREPVRGVFGDDGHAPVKLSAAAVAAALARSPQLGASVLVLVLSSITLGASYWLPAFLVRSLHLSLSQAGPLAALAVGAPGGLGAVAGGFASQRWAHARNDRLMILCAGALVLAVPFGLAGVLAQPPALICAGVALWSFFNSFYISPGYSVCLAATPVAMRGTVASLVVVLSNVLGAGLGPQIVGLLSDHFHRAGDPPGLGHALACIRPAGVVGGGILLAARAATLRRPGPLSPLAAGEADVLAAERAGLE